MGNESSKKQNKNKAKTPNANITANRNNNANKQQQPNYKPKPQAQATYNTQGATNTSNWISKWACSYCTLENEFKSEICQMCFQGDRPATAKCPQCNETMFESDLAKHKTTHAATQARQPGPARIHLTEEYEAKASQRHAQQRQQEQEKQHPVMRPLKRTDSEERVAVLISSLAARVLGFEYASEENRASAIRKLDEAKCCKQTALRDAIYLGVGRMMKLKGELEKIKALDHNFINIILTDGEDTSSELGTMEFLAFQHLLDKADFHEICRMMFVGVGLNDEASKELKLYSALGGKHATFENCDAIDIEKVFNHVSLNLIRRTRIAAMTDKDSGQAIVGVSQEHELALGVNHFLVLLTLDISGSMAGSRWKAVKRAVKSLLDNLKESDLFGIILFNDDATMITG